MTFHQGLTRTQGDPGIFGTLGRIIKGAAGGLLTGGPIGAITGGIAGGVGPQQRMPVPIGVPLPPVPIPGITGFVQRRLPGGASGFECPPGGGCPSGFRPNKSAYFLKDGTFVAPGTRCVKVRRMNAANGKAVRRAIRRENSFIKLAVGTGLVRAPRASRVRKAAGKR